MVVKEEKRKMKEVVQVLRGPFDLSVERKPESQYFHMQTQFVHIGFDGKRTGTETYLLRLRCIPAALSGKNLNEYTCREFGLRINTGAIATIPALQSWTYRFDLMSGVDGKGPVFGISHDRFEGITDSLGDRKSVV